MNRNKIVMLVLFVLLVASVGFQSFRLVRANQAMKLNSEELVRQNAVFVWKAQYQQVLDKITVQSVDTLSATLIYWTENVTKEGRTVLHGSAIVNGIVYDSQITNDVTDYLIK